VADIEAGVSMRTRELRENILYNCFRYSIGAGFRIPGPFLWGLEFAGQAATPSGSPEAEPFTSAYFRFFMEYSL